MAAIAVGLLPVSPASAAVADICPAAGQTDRFTDDAGNVHEANINCAAAYQLVTGTTATTYNPEGNLTRGQAATILVNYVERSTGTVLVTDATADFTDTAGNVHATNIEKAADNDIVRGFPDRTFRPNQLITRAQFASIAVQATERVLGTALPRNAATNSFDDDNGNVHESNIEKAVQSGILEGTGARTFSPNANITRGQTATIVIRAAGNVLFPAGRFAPRTGAAQAFAVTPNTALTQTVDTGRQFSVTVPAGTGALVLELFACANIRESDTTFAGSAPGLAGNVALPGTVGSTITVVNGNPVTAASRIALAATTTGTVTFTVTGAAGQCVLPVVYRDADASGTLNLGANNRPTEGFGLGGRTTFVAAQAATGAIATGTVSLVDLANNLFQQGTASYTYGRAGDIFQLSVGGVCTTSTLEAFEQRLSVDDAVTGTYNRAGGSLFCLVDSGPQGPTGVTAPADTRTVTFGDSPTATVASYNVYRAAGIPGVIGGAAASCPAVTATGAWTSIGTVADTSLTAGGTGTYTFTDATAATGSLQCYAASAVDRTGDEGPIIVAAGPRTTVAADTTPPSFSATGTSATQGTRTVTVGYSEAIRCNTVAANGSDFLVQTVTGVGFVNANPAVAAQCVAPTATGLATAVTITVTNLIADPTARVTSQVGSDGNTVLDAAGNAQTAGQVVQAATGAGGAPPPAQATNNLASASAAANTQLLTVTYGAPVLCSTVATGDFTFTLTAGGTGTIAPTSVACDGTSDATLVFTFPGTPFTNQAGTVAVTAGAVSNAAGTAQTGSTTTFTTAAAAA